MSAIAVSVDQIRWFRARRSHLAGPGAADPVTAARAILGAQAQQLPQALWALAVRTAGCPPAARVAPLVGERPALIRTWGQRGTAHLYAPEDWPLVAAGWAQWGGRRESMATEPLLDRVLAALTALGRPVRTGDVEALAPADVVEALTPAAEKARMTPRRLAGRRLIWALSHRGDLCAVARDGATQLYMTRANWCPALPWDPIDSDAANTALTRRYLALYGPASPQDVAHYFGARVRDARRWLAAFADERIDVGCEGRKELTLMAADADAVREAPPDDPARWPLRMLPLWDTLLMGHADKSVVAPADADRKAIWRKASYVAAAVLHRGQIVAVWKHTTQARAVKIAVTPLSGWSAALRPALEAEANAFAQHLDRPAARVVMQAQIQ